MINTNETAKKSQGDNMAEIDKTADTVKKTEERNPSSTYTIKSLAGNIKKLEKLKMCNTEELTQLKKIHKTIMERWIGGNLGL